MIEVNDNPNWDWAKGFCRLHLGQDLPCKLCIKEETNEFFKKYNEVKITPLSKDQYVQIAKDSIANNPALKQYLDDIDFDNPTFLMTKGVFNMRFKLKSGDTINLEYRID